MWKHSKTAFFCSRSRAMKDLNSLVSKSTNILEQEGLEPSKSLALIVETLTSNARKAFRGYPGGGDSDPVLDICLGIGPDCRLEVNRPFRSFNGTCNNLNRPLWGSILTAFKREANPAYNNGIDTPRGAVSTVVNGRKKRSAVKELGIPEFQELVNENDLEEMFRLRPCSSLLAGILPNPRLVSSTFHPDQNIPSKVATHMVAIMGQFLDHDITLTPEEEAEGCCCGSTEEACFPIRVDKNDPFFQPHKVGCLDFTRSLAFCEEFQRVREQLNGITAFVDASNVYGSTEEVAASLRTFSDGFMKTSNSGPYDMLPIINGTFKAGDIRALENPALTSMHTLFVREHNRIARRLQEISPDLHDEDLYQQTRRIVIAEMQNVVYGGYLPMVLGWKAMHQYELVLDHHPSTYNPTQEPTITNEFATGAYRFGHSMIQGVVNMLGEMTQQLEGQYKLRENFFNTANYLASNGAGMEKILAGLVSQEAQTADRFVIEDVTNHLFPQNGASFGSDLIARNIQRGRDHGLASYNAYRELCGQKPACTWKQKPADISQQNWNILRKLYNHPNDIDFFVGGLAENPAQDGLTGQTFQCIKSRQFNALKYGDRYFFTHEGQAGSFNQDQMFNLFQRTLGDIICDNTQIYEVRKDVFDANSSFQNCKEKNHLLIELFKEI